MDYWIDVSGEVILTTVLKDHSLRTQSRQTILSLLLILQMVCGGLIALSPIFFPIASASAPTCNGSTATIYVDSGLIVGGASNGQAYAGTLTGTSSADVIVGTSGDDIINASGGNDTICPGDGTDTVDGGTGTNTLAFSTISGSSGVTVNITGAASGTVGSSTFSNIGNVTGTDYNDTFTIPNNTGSMSVINGGTGTDTLDYTGRTSAVQVTLGSASRLNIENLTGTSGGDIIFGSSSANVINGAGGNDIIVGGSGNDTITGGGGRNILIGDAGSDAITEDATSTGDIEIADTYASETTTPLSSILSEWVRTDITYATRVAHIFGSLGGGLNGSNLMNTSTVSADSYADTLTGNSSSAINWYFRDDLRGTLIGNFAGETVTVVSAGTGYLSGVVYNDAGVTAIGSGRTVSVSINGAAAAASAVTTSTGAYTMTGLILSAGDIVSLYLDNSTEKGVTVTAGNAISMSGMTVYRNRLIARCESSCALSNANLSTAANNGDSDISSVYAVSGGSLEVKAGKALIVWTGHTFTPAGNVSVGSGITINGTLSAGSNTVTLSGSWLKPSTGTFTAGTGTVKLNGTSQTLSGSSTFYNLTKITAAADTLTFAAGATQTVSNTLTLQGAAGNLLSLRSSQTGNQWRINPQGTRTIDYLDVKDSNNTNASAIIAAGHNVTNSTNNTNWTFFLSTTTTLSATPNPSTVDDNVTLTATVTSGATGTVTFKDGSTTIGTTSLGQGSGSIVTNALSVGSHSLTAVYGGDTTYLTSTSSGVTQVVNDVASSSSSSSADSLISSESANTPEAAAPGGRHGHTDDMARRISAAQELLLSRQLGAVQSASSSSALHEAATSSSLSPLPFTPIIPNDSTSGIIVGEERGHLASINGDHVIIYRDVPIDAWYAPYVSFLIQSGIAEGYTDADGNPTGEFGSNASVTNAEMLKFAMELAGKKPLDGVPDNLSARHSWAAAYVKEAENEHLIVFTPSLDINAPATRGAVIQTILEIIGYMINKADPSYIDVPASHPYAHAIATASFLGLIDGYKDQQGNPLNVFHPDAPVNRAEMAKIVTLARKLLQ